MFNYQRVPSLHTSESFVSETNLKRIQESNCKCAASGVWNPIWVYPKMGSTPTWPDVNWCFSINHWNWGTLSSDKSIWMGKWRIQRFWRWLRSLISPQGPPMKTLGSTPKRGPQQRSGSIFRSSPHRHRKTNRAPVRAAMATYAIDGGAEIAAPGRWRWWWPH